MFRKTALVTGGTSGLGFEVVARLAEKGYNVFSLSKNQENIDIANKVYRTAKCRCRPSFMQCDISDERSVEQAADIITSCIGHLDLLVNNAATIKVGGIEDLDFDDFERVMHVNVAGAFLVTKYMMKALKNSEDAKVINISSVSGRMPSSSLAYSASKAALDIMSKCMAKELGKYGIRVNTVVPGMFDSGFQIHEGDTNSDDYEHIKEVCGKSYILGLGNIENVADAVMYLTSDNCKWMTGSELVVDGGLSVMR